MSRAVEVDEHANLVDRQVIRRTVAVVDMVGYSHVARLLEENISSSSVSELNAQIQAFMSSALAAAGDSCQVVSRTGDGIIVLFQHPEAAHRFGYQVHCIAADHNAHRTERTAQRRFRVGIATGDVTVTTSSSGQPEYAGTTIANAVRLEAAAGPGQLLIDQASFAALPHDLQTLYEAEETVKGKRDERYRVRRCRVDCKPSHTFTARHRLLSRRALLGGGAVLAAGAAAAVWVELPALEERLHPLPDKRFVALLAWPPSQERDASLVSTVLDSISARLTRAEAAVRNLLILSAADLVGVGKAATVPQESVASLGANLVLAASLDQRPSKVRLQLQVLDAAESKVLRSRTVTMPTQQMSSLADRASEASLKLLDLPQQQETREDADELRSLPPEAFAQFSQAQALVAQPNDTGLQEGIAKYQDLLTALPQFALGYASLAMAYVRSFLRTGEQPVLALASRNAALALEYNAHSARALLSAALAALYSGQNEEADRYFAKALAQDPANSEVLLYRAQALRNLDKWKQAQATYEQIVSRRPNYWPAYNELGLMLGRQAQYKKAAEAFGLASALAPTVALPLANLSQMYMETGDNAEAKRTALRSIAVHPTAEAYLILGDLAFSDNAIRDALHNYTAAADLKPAFHLIWRNIGDCYTVLGPESKVKENYGRAAACLTNDLRINPKRGSLWMTLAFYQAKTGLVTEAMQSLHQADVYHATDLQSQFVKVQALAVLGKSKEALELLTKCIDQGLSPLEVDAALDLKQITNDPTYIHKLTTVKAPVSRPA